MRFELPRGMRDIEDEEYMLIEHARDRFIESARLFNFSMVEPSPIELLSTLEAKSGPMIADEIYAFKDKAGRDIALRFDLTVGITRYVAGRRDLKMPIKLAAFGPVWRYDEPQMGRYRWFHQWDVEIYDNFSIESDAEVIEFTKHYLNSLGIQARIEVSDRRMLEGMIRRRLGIEDEHQVLEMLRAVDKLSKKSRDAILQEYASKGIDAERLRLLLDVAGLKGSLDDVLKSDHLKGMDVDTSRLTALIDSLKARGVSDVVVNMSIVRGLDYYSSIVFEVFSGKSNLALVGGGRYDILPEVFGRKDMGATGAAGGVERLILLLKDIHGEGDGLIMHSKNMASIFIAYADDGLRSKAVMLASDLRRKGVKSECIAASLKRQLDYASSKGYRFAAILTDRMGKEKMVTLRNMVDGSEKVIMIDKLLTDPLAVIGN
ncbi:MULTISPECIES: histidine--tRNA ligase [Candidatus Nitrosocaldus]|uniref:Histidine--tRNA ligase n=1 Tax=Candidatus Nitrosocaldus cavascurensis TaxID=2058097 RepID=A0A2K5APG7_9ARCH|nr:MULTISPECIES: histidine--tRNA ligase [Candidatus Nitrosocaldus]SPC33534.1 Histidine--tRNA ligase [Candidatus Nitrosocaldus cavascurensis]